MHDNVQNSLYRKLQIYQKTELQIHKAILQIIQFLEIQGFPFQNLTGNLNS